MNQYFYSHHTPALILSGGTEIVSLAIAESLSYRGIPIYVVSLGKPSILRGLPGVCQHAVIEWPPYDALKTSKKIHLIGKKWGAGNPDKWPIFTTEDGGLRLVYEHVDAFKEWAFFSKSPYLNWGGLDKLELASILIDAGFSKNLPKTIRVQSIADFEKAFDAIDGLAVLKPALKPYYVTPKKMSSKAIVVGPDSTERKMVSKKLNRWFHEVPTWILQEHLTTPQEGEASWWGVRDKDGQLNSITGRQIWKVPRNGGTACWVKTERIDELHQLSRKILEALEYEGLVELEFLQKPDGTWCLVEANSRVWLQGSLPEKAGAALLYNTYQSFFGDKMTPLGDIPDGVQWVCIERLIQAVYRSEYGSRIKQFANMISLLKNADAIPIYNSPFTGLKYRWLLYLLKRILLH